jgi:hypothetical protein
VWTQKNAGFHFENAGKLIGGQLLYLGPLVVVLFVLTAGDFLKRRHAGTPDIPQRLLWAAALPALVLTYLLCTWSSEAEPHWPAVGYLPLFPLTAAFIARSGARIRRLAGITVAFGVLVLIVAQVAVLTPLVPRLTPPGRYEPKLDLSNELRGWPEVADTLRALNPDGQPVIAAFYTQCSQLAFALSRPGDPEVRCISKEIDDFDIWYGRFELPESGAFFVTDNRFEHDIGRLLPIAKRVDPPLTVEIARAGRPVRRFRIIHVAP